MWTSDDSRFRPVAPGDTESAHAPTPPSIEAKEPRTDDVGDARLVERVRSGDDQAFAALVARYERKLIRVLTRLVHQP